MHTKKKKKTHITITVFHIIGIGNKQYVTIQTKGKCIPGAVSHDSPSVRRYVGLYFFDACASMVLCIIHLGRRAEMMYGGDPVTSCSGLEKSL